MTGLKFISFTLKLDEPSMCLPLIMLKFHLEFLFLSLLNQEFSWSFLLFSHTYYPILYNYPSLGQALN